MEIFSLQFIGTPIVEQTEHSIHEMDVKAFNLILSALQYLMSSEQQLMAGIIPHQYQKGIFEKISRESLDLVIRDSDAIISRVKKSSSNNDFLSIISVFQGKYNLKKNLEFYKKIYILFFSISGQTRPYVETKHGSYIGSIGSRNKRKIQ